MRFLGRLAIILTVALGAAMVHSMQWPITRDMADAMERRDRVPPAEPTRKPDSDSKEATPPDPDSGDTQPDEPELGVDPTVEDPIPLPDEGEPQEDLPDYYISVEQAYEYWEQAMPFIDARTDAERTVGTVEGAFHLETRDFIGISGRSAQVLGQIDRAFPVIIFCGGGECDASENVAQRLIGRGYTVYIMHEGFGAWEAAGHPTEPVGGG